jgi:hypothetical protein
MAETSGKPGRKPDNEHARESKLGPIRVTAEEQAKIEAAAGERGEAVAQALRSMPAIWSERQRLVTTALEMIRGKLTRDEVTLILSAMNGVYMPHETSEFIGQQVAANVHDFEREDDPLATMRPVSAKKLAKKIHGFPLVARVALELWCADLWRQCDPEEDDVWQQQIDWLVGEPS